MNLTVLALCGLLVFGASAPPARDGGPRRQNETASVVDLGRASAPWYIWLNEQTILVWCEDGLYSQNVATGQRAALAGFMHAVTGADSDIAPMDRFALNSGYVAYIPATRARVPNQFIVAKLDGKESKVLKLPAGALRWTSPVWVNRKLPASNNASRESDRSDVFLYSHPLGTPTETAARHGGAITIWNRSSDHFETIELDDSAMKGYAGAEWALGATADNKLLLSDEGYDDPKEQTVSLYEIAVNARPITAVKHTRKLPAGTALEAVAVSASGTRLAWLLQPGVPDAAGNYSSDPEIWLSRIDGTGFVKAHVHGNPPPMWESPSLQWSPDGKRLSYAYGKDDDVKLYIVSVE